MQNMAANREAARLLASGDIVGAQKIILDELIEEETERVYLQQIIDNTDVTTTDNGDGTFTRTFTPKKSQ